MIKHKILGVDPGKTGALAFYDENELIIYDMPTLQDGKRVSPDEHRITAIIKEQKPNEAFIEHVKPIHKSSATSAFTFGRMFEAPIAVCAALSLPMTLVLPQTWKKELSCPRDKDGARSRASQLLPQFAHNWPLKKHDGRAEAALIAYYGWKSNNI